MNFHSVSLSEPSQSVKTPLWWPTWRWTRWPTWRWTRWPTLTWKSNLVRVGHGGCLIGPRRFRPQVYPYCASFKLCEFILFQILPILLELEFKSISFPSQLCNTNRYPLKQMLPTQWDFHVVLFQIWIYGGPIHILPLNWCEYPLNGQLAQT